MGVRSLMDARQGAPGCQTAPAAHDLLEQRSARGPVKAEVTGSIPVQVAMTALLDTDDQVLVGRAMRAELTDIVEAMR